MIGSGGIALFEEAFFRSLRAMNEIVGESKTGLAGYLGLMLHEAIKKIFLVNIKVFLELESVIRTLSEQ